jgi:hypothetical protein
VNHGIIKKIIFVTILAGINSRSFAATDSTRLAPPTVKPAAQPYLLSQGTISSSSKVNIEATKLRCNADTTPLLRISLIKTQLNFASPIKGIENTLQLNNNDYVIYGDLYILNLGSSNSLATANWQIWCQPNQLA